MRGHRPTSMPSWPSSHTMCPTMGNWVHTFFDLLTSTILYACRGAPHRLLGTNWGALGWEHGGGSMANYGTIWPRWKSKCLIICPCILLTWSQIIAIVMDNASNNNTLMILLEAQCQQRGISFSAQDSRMWCIPHTIHLAAIKVCTLQFLIIPSQL